MQYDLFHAYTVDAHTLFVVSNLRRFAHRALRPRAPRGSRDHAAAAEAGSRLPRRAVPRHRQGPRRRSLRARRGGCRGLLPRAGPLALRRAPGRLAGAQSPDALGDRAEAGHRRSAGRSTRSRARSATRRISTISTCSPCADVRGTNPKLWNSWKASLFEDFYERVKRALRRGLESADRPRATGAPRRRTRRARLLIERGVAETRHRSRLGALLGDATSCGTRPRRSPGTRGYWPSATRRPMSRWWRRRAHGVRGTTAVLIFTRRAPPQLRAHHRGARPARTQHRRCAHHADGRWLQPRSPTSCSRTTARAITDHDRMIEIEQALWRSRTGARRMRRCRYRGAHRARCACSTRRRRSRSAIDERNQRSVLELIAGDRPGPPVATSARCWSRSASSCTPPRS